MRKIVQYHNEPELNEALKQTISLRLSKNIIDGRRYDVYLIPLPVGIARALELPIGLSMNITYDPKEKNKLTLRWENGPANTKANESSMDIEVQGDR